MAMNVDSVADVGATILDAVERVIVGTRPVLERVLWAVLGDGHLLIEDVPGLAKTLIAKSFAASLGLAFRRIQFTPDLLPADITGTYVYDRKASEFVLRRGPIFTNVLLADEINRAPPKTQSALLEAMQERQATLEGYMVDIVLGTRAHSQVEVGASPRGSLALLKVARARAAIAGRDFVTPDDVKTVAGPALAHRLILKPDPWIRGVRTTTVLTDVLAQVPVPKVP